MRLQGIDVHVHCHDKRVRDLRGHTMEHIKERAAYFRREGQYLSVEDQAEEYRALNMMAVLMNSTDATITGRPSAPNDFFAEVVKEHPDVFMAMGIIDPWMGELAREEIVRIKELGLHGIGELNPARQHFYANDRRFYPLWEEAQAQGLPILFHTGYAAAGTGTRGGGNVRLKYCQPIYLDDVAADFPDLILILAHPSWPWTAESLAIARHKPNVYIDLSGWAPKYIPSEVIDQVNHMIPHKTLFGSDAPSLPRDRWLKEFAELPIKDEIRPKIMLENAAQIFGIDLEGTQ